MGFFRAGGSANALSGKKVQKPTTSENGKVLAYNSSTDEFVWVTPEMAAGAVTVVMDSGINGRILVDGSEIEVYNDSNKENKIRKSPTAPFSATLGDLWIDTSVTPKVLKYYDGTAWLIVGNRLTISDSTVNGNILVNDQEIVVYDDSSVTSNISTLQSDMSTAKTDITNLKGSQHSHTNKSSLDRFGINGNGNLTIDGVEYIGGGTGGSIPSNVIYFENWTGGENVTIDTGMTTANTAPTISSSFSTSSTNDTTSISIPYSITDTEGGSFTATYIKDGVNSTATVNTGSNTWNVGILAVGSHTLSIQVKDSGNLNSNTLTFNITVSASADTESPSPISSLTVGTVTSNSIPLTWVLSPSGDVANQEVSYSTDGINYTVASAVINPSSTSYAINGLNTNTLYTVRVVTIDGVGNRSTPVTVQTTTAIETDTTAPTVNASPVGGTYTSAQTVTLSTEVGATIFYTLDGTNPDETDTVYSSPISIPDDVTLKYIGKDIAGNVSAVQTQTYTIQAADGNYHLYFDGTGAIQFPSGTAINGVEIEASIYEKNTSNANNAGYLMDFRASTGSWNNGYVFDGGVGAGIATYAIDGVAGTDKTTHWAGITKGVKHTLKYTGTGSYTGGGAFFMRNTYNDQKLRADVYKIRLYNGTTLVAEYDFTNQFEGTVVLDKTGNGRNATLIGGSWVAN